MKKLPPIEKIYEAYSAVADGRVKIDENELTNDAPGCATVISSNGAKTYNVTWEDNIYSSNDNATYWQGYPGYPVIAVLMLQGRLPFNSNIAGLFGGINWTELNARHKGDYGAALREIMQEHNYNDAAIDTSVQGVYARLETLPVIIRRGPARPPK